MLKEVYAIRIQLGKKYVDCGEFGWNANEIDFKWVTDTIKMDDKKTDLTTLYHSIQEAVFPLLRPGIKPEDYHKYQKSEDSLWNSRF